MKNILLLLTTVILTACGDMNSNSGKPPAAKPVYTKEYLRTYYVGMDTKLERLRIATNGRYELLKMTWKANNGLQRMELTEDSIECGDRVNWDLNPDGGGASSLACAGGNPFQCPQGYPYYKDMKFGTTEGLYHHRQGTVVMGSTLTRCNLN